MGKKSREKHLRKEQNKNNYQEKKIHLSSQWEKVCFFIVKYGIYLALFSPLILSRDYFFPFLVPKTIFFRLIVSIIFIAYILLITINPRFKPRINFLTIVIGFFISVLLLTSILGVNFSRSFWSVFERMEGLLTFFHLFAFYLVLTGFLKEKKDWQNVLSVSIFVAVLVSFNVLFSTNPMTRGGGTIGNSSFFSAYVLFNLFFAFILLFMKKGSWRIFYGLSSIVFLCSLFFNPLGFTKGAVSSLGIGLAFLIISLMFFSKIRLLKIALPFILILLTLAGYLIIKDFYFQDREFNLREIPDRSRQIVWQMAWQGWQERFWFGWGLENFSVPFNKYYDPELPKTGDVWYDRVHNIVLDTGITSGIIGLLSYLSIFGAAIYGLVKFLLKQENIKEKIIPLAIITLLLIYFIQNLWVFDMISTYIMFFLTLAFISFLISSQKPEQEKATTLPTFLGSLLIIVAVSAFVFGNIQPARSAKLIIKGLSHPLNESILAFEKAFKTSAMTRFEGPEQLSSKVSSLVNQADQDRTLLNQGFQLAAEKFKENIDQNPLDFRVHLFLGRHYNIFYQLTNNKEYLDSAQQLLEKALELGPNNQQVYFILAETMLAQGEKEKAINLLEKANDLDPYYFQAQMYLIRGYRMVEDYEKAFNQLEALEEIGYFWQENADVLREKIEILKGQGEDINNLIPLYEKGIELNPRNVGLWQSFINAYLEIGQIDKAKQLIKAFSEFNPEYKNEADQFLKSLEEITAP
jgi:O-antigen ligase